MTTYSALLSQVLTLTDTTGQTDVEEVAKIGLRETLRYIATKAVVPELRERAECIWEDGEETVFIQTATEGLTDYCTPIRLFVNEIPYEYYDYMDWLDLENIPSPGPRQSINSPITHSRRAEKAWTIATNNEVFIDPTPVAGDEVVLFYHKEPAAYDDDNIPEINARFDFVLVQGAILVVKEFLREPEQLTAPHILFSSLDDQIRELSIHQASLRRRGHFRMSAKYTA